VLKVQDDSFQVVEILGERVQSLGLATSVNYEIMDFRRKAANVLRVVTIFRVIVASGEQLSARQRYRQKCYKASRDGHVRFSVISWD
jgi:hypothetical protein